MRYLYFLLFLFLIGVTSVQTSLSLNAQTLPGGVRGVEIWHAAVADSTGQAVWADKLTGVHLSSPQPSRKTINHHAGYIFSAADARQYTVASLGAFTVFTVAQPIDTLKEQCIWHVENDTSLQLVLTTKRMADVANFSYMSFPSGGTAPKIYSYTQRKSGDTLQAASYRLKMGIKPASAQIPPDAFGGITGETIVFGKALSVRERLKVQSYLAVKYGIPIDQTIESPYLSAAADTVWSPVANAAYAHDVFGVARDTLSGLDQQWSRSAHSGGLLHLKMADTLPHGVYLLGGHNGEALKTSEHEGQPARLARLWRFQRSGTGELPACAVSFDPLLIDQISPLRQGERFWLAIDGAGDGTFAATRTRYVKSSSEPRLGVVQRFEEVRWDSDLSGFDVAAVVCAPDFFITAECLHPSCADAHSGQINVRAVGGDVPYRITVYDEAGNVAGQTTVSDSIGRFVRLSQGAYTVQAVDAKGRSSAQAVELLPDELATPALHKNYTLAKGRTITIDASEGADARLDYTWSHEGRLMSASSEVTVERPGIYTLTLFNGQGCAATKLVSVTSDGDQRILQSTLTPNPTDGPYNLRVQLSREAPLQVALFDIMGQQISKVSLYGSDFYRLQGHIAKSGTYLIEMKSGTSSQSLKLLVK